MRLTKRRQKHNRNNHYFKQKGGKEINYPPHILEKYTTEQLKEMDKIVEKDKESFQNGADIHAAMQIDDMDDDASFFDKIWTWIIGMLQTFVSIDKKQGDAIPIISTSAHDGNIIGSLGGKLTRKKRRNRKKVNQNKIK